MAAPGRRIADMVLMFQKEVADRLAAGRAAKTTAACRCWPSMSARCSAVRRRALAFVPPPKVVSSVVRLTPRPTGHRLADLAAGADHRRGLRPAPQDAAQCPRPRVCRSLEVLNSLDIPPTARAEELASASSCSSHGP